MLNARLTARPHESSIYYVIAHMLHPSRLQLTLEVEPAPGPTWWTTNASSVKLTDSHEGETLLTSLLLLLLTVHGFPVLIK